MEQTEEYQELAREINSIYYEAGEIIGHEAARVLHSQAIAQVDHSGLADLLIKKGYFTKEEYHAALVASAVKVKGLAREWLEALTLTMGQAEDGQAEDEGPPARSNGQAAGPV